MRPDVELTVISYAGPESWSVEDVAPARLVLLAEPAHIESSASIGKFARRIRDQAVLFHTCRKIIKLNRPDLVHVWYDQRPLSLVRALFRSRGLLEIIHLHDVRPHIQSARTRWVYYYSKFVVRRAPIISVFSEHLRSEAIAEFGVSEEKIVVVRLPPGGMGQPVGRNIERLDRLGEQGHKLRLLFFGSIRRNKGIATIASALKQLPADVDFELRIAGRMASDVDPEFLQEMDHDFRVKTESGEVSETRKDSLFRWADLVLLPYKDFHGESAVLRDAMWYGVPIVGSRLPQFKIVEDRNWGTLHGPEDAHGLAEIVAEMTNRDDLVRSFAESLLADRNLSDPGVWSDELVGTYRSLL